jgi:hypothetical protein
VFIVPTIREGRLLLSTARGAEPYDSRGLQNQRGRVKAWVYSLPLFHAGLRGENDTLVDSCMTDMPVRVGSSFHMGLEQMSAFRKMPI